MFQYFKFFIITLCLLNCNPTVDSKLKNVAVDVIVVVHGNFFRDQAKLDNVRETLLEFPKEFEMGETKMRAALVTCHGTTCDVRLEFTADEAKFRESVKNQSLAGQESASHDLRLVFETIRERLFPKSYRPIAALILTDDPAPQKLGDAVEEAKELRSSRPSAMLFIVHSALDSKKFAEMIGDSENTLPFNGTFTKDILDDVKKKMDKEFCRYKKTCAFADASAERCYVAWFYPLMDETQNACSDIRPLPTAEPNKTCNLEKCRETCDKLWPFVECGESPKRDGSRPYKFLEHCPQKCTVTTTRQPVIIDETSPPRKSVGQLRPQMWMFALGVLGFVVLLSAISCTTMGVVTFREKMQVCMERGEETREGDKKQQGSEQNA